MIAFSLHKVMARSALPLAVLLSGCLGGFQVAESPAAMPAFRPEAFFDGATRGEGMLDVRGRADRHFTVASTGHSKRDSGRDSDFVLDQVIRYADGEVQRRRFRMRHLDAQRYTGSLTGAAGPVTARAEGNSFHLRYSMGKARSMEQWIYLQPGGRTAFNRATVRVLGMPVAHLSETIRRD